MSQRWSGHVVRQARAHWAPIVRAGGVDCPRCGLPILPEQRWHVGHVLDRALGGGRLDWRVNTRPEHGSCNEAAGGRLAHALKGRRSSARPPAPPASVPVVARRDWT